MTIKGDLLYASASDSGILKKGECGGAVTAILKNALESGIVDAVLAVKKGYDVFDASPVLITNPEDIADTAGSLHCGTLLIPKLIKKYLDGAEGMKIAVTMKGCDAKAMYELAKRGQVNLDNIYMVGLNCGGSVSPMVGRDMITEVFEIDPDTVVKEEIDKGQFIVETSDGQHKGISIDDLEDEGFGRRDNCQRCKTKIPRQCDLACGNWGVIGESAGKATFVEVCSDKGAELVTSAESNGALKTEQANEKGLMIRSKIEGAMFKLADKRREEQFAKMGSGKDRLDFIMKETSRCIKCYQCIENCPVCYCIECSSNEGHPVPKGQIPPPFTFHVNRYSQIADSCINCGQCQELCPMDIPNSLYMHAVQIEMEDMFGYEPGVNLDLPVIALAEEPAKCSK
ncbi:MAG: Coenzyme F420 hydrogenase/dehydrogenase, beta subunit C-terminal domain [Methanomicrobiaceae archaeon]|nr:Coenzyme F420 hydrogenase/dehydrogenase, beta subunit C-terminal domain [Methanomicrobiaceae archaeon]